jgi:hypothetical protein
MRCTSFVMVLACGCACACAPAPTEGEGEGEGEGELVCDTGDDATLGFPLRTPTNETVACEIDEFSCPDGSASLRQVDYACTLTTGGQDAVVFVRANPTAVHEFGYGLYDDVHGWVHDNASDTTECADAAFDYGGGHNNDSFDITVGGTTVRYFHSSFGFGYRACQPPDCVQILDADGLVVDDGCTPDRSHPEACVAITDASLALPIEDAFARCQGDPNGT